MTFANTGFERYRAKRNVQFRHLLEENNVGPAILREVNQLLASRKVKISTGTIVENLNATTFTREPLGALRFAEELAADVVAREDVARAAFHHAAAFADDVRACGEG